MDTIIVNGSPNAGRGNTEIFIQHFAQGMGQSPEVRYTASEDPAALAEYIAGFESMLFFLPLYVHAMPGRVMKLMEHMREARPGQRLGFVVQQGFVESSNSDYLVPYLEHFADMMGYEYLGTVVKGGAAGTRYMPESMNRKLFRQVEQLGEVYAATGKLGGEPARQLAEPHRLSKGKVRLYRATTALGLNHLFWHRMMKIKGGFQNRLDKPFYHG